MRKSGNTILVTGGGTGIGRGLAQRWADEGNTVVIAGRTARSLEEAAEGRHNIHTITLDTRREDAITHFAETVIKRFPALNVLVNNAGIMRYEDITGPRNLDDAEETIATNLLGPIRLTDALIAHLKGQKNAAIINVTSGLAFVPLPNAATYSATKAALHSYTVSLRAKLVGQVEVIEIAPPAVQTDLTPGQATRGGYMPLDAFLKETMAQFGNGETPPEVLTQAAARLRHAERDGTFDSILTMFSNN